MDQREIETRIRALTMVRNAGGTYRAAGDKYGISPQSISRYANGRTRPQNRTLDNLRALTGQPAT